MELVQDSHVTILGIFTAVCAYGVLALFVIAATTPIFWFVARILGDAIDFSVALQAISTLMLGNTMIELLIRLPIHAYLVTTGSGGGIIFLECVIAAARLYFVLMVFSEALNVDFGKAFVVALVQGVLSLPVVFIGLLVMAIAFNVSAGVMANNPEQAFFKGSEQKPADQVVVSGPPAPYAGPAGGATAPSGVPPSPYPPPTTVTQVPGAVVPIAPATSGAGATGPTTTTTAESTIPTTPTSPTPDKVAWTVTADPPSRAPETSTKQVSIPIPGGRTEVLYPATPSALVAVGSNQLPSDSREVWNTAKGVKLATVSGFLPLKAPWAIDPSGQWLAGLSTDMVPAIDVYSITSGKRTLRMPVGDSPPSSIDFLDGERLLARTVEGSELTAQVCNAVTGSRSDAFTLAGATAATPIAISAGGKFLAVGRGTAGIDIYNVETGAVAGQIVLDAADNRGSIVGLSFAPGGSELAALLSGNSGGSALSWDLSTGHSIVSHALSASVGMSGGPTRFQPEWLSYAGPALEWTADGSAWLICGRALVGRNTGEFLKQVPLLYQKSAVRKVFSSERALVVSPLRSKSIDGYMLESIRLGPFEPGSPGASMVAGAGGSYSPAGSAPVAGARGAIPSYAGSSRPANAGAASGRPYAPSAYARPVMPANGAPAAYGSGAPQPSGALPGGVEPGGVAPGAFAPGNEFLATARQAAAAGDDRTAIRMLYAEAVGGSNPQFLTQRMRWSAGLGRAMLALRITVGLENSGGGAVTTRPFGSEAAGSGPGAEENRFINDLQDATGTIGTQIVAAINDRTSRRLFGAWFESPAFSGGVGRGAIVVGNGDQATLLEKSQTEEADALVLFQLISPQRFASQRNNQSLMVRVFDVATKKEVWTSKPLASSKAGSTVNGKDLNQIFVNSMLGYLDGKLKLEPISKPEKRLVNLRMKQLREATPARLLPAIAEVRLYQELQAIDPETAESVLAKLLGPDDGKTMATGTAGERRLIVQRMLAP